MTEPTTTAQVGPSRINHARELLGMIETLAQSGPKYLPDIASHARKALDLLTSPEEIESRNAFVEAYRRATS